MSPTRDVCRPTFVASLISLTGHVKMVRTELSERSRARIPHTTPERCRLMKDTQKKQRLGQSLTTTPMGHAQNKTKFFLHVGNRYSTPQRGTF